VNSVLGEEKETTIQPPLLVFFSPSKISERRGKGKGKKI